MRMIGRGAATQRRGKSKRWRAEKRAAAEAESARRKRERDARRSERVGIEPEPIVATVFAADVATRFAQRRASFRARYGRLGGMVHGLAWVLHNCVAHPCLGLAPGRLSLWLHDRSADWLNLSPVATRSEPPTIDDRRAWLIHNCIAHPLMGLAPLHDAFSFHDHSAEVMGVEGWV